MDDITKSQKEYEELNLKYIDMNRDMKKSLNEVSVFDIVVSILLF